MTGGGDVFPLGDLAPGNSTASVLYDSNLFMGPTTHTLIELAGNGGAAGSDFDQLDVTGSVNLDGTLELLPLASYADPATRGTSDDFVIVTAGTRIGTFATVKYNGSTLAADSGPDGNGSFRDHVGSGLFRSVTYTATSVALRNLLALSGDADGDKDVDITDFNTLADNFDPVPLMPAHDWTEADFDADTDVDITDFNALAANFAPMGYGGGDGPGQVPEPSTLVLFTLGVIGTAGIVFWRRRQ